MYIYAKILDLWYKSDVLGTSLSKCNTLDTKKLFYAMFAKIM
jgi:hypothetical protein